MFGDEPGKEKVFFVYSEDDLVNKTKLVPQFPAVGVMYEGLRPTQTDPSRQGLAVDCNIAVALLVDAKVATDLQSEKNVASFVLTGLRNAISKKTSPTGHKWRFVYEGYVGDIKGLSVYVQRWATAGNLS